MNKPQLPAIQNGNEQYLTALTASLGLPRDVIATGAEIQSAWSQLPTILAKIDPGLRDQLLVRMCIATATGLFDGAINYCWNATVSELREKIRRFGLNVVQQITGKTFDEKALQNLKDSELVDLCLKLSLVSEDGYYFLDQCRDIRNNYSAAHPPMGAIDSPELIAYINRCAKYALGTIDVPRGVDIQGLLNAIRGGEFDEHQADHWNQAAKQTHESQREMIAAMAHGIYFQIWDLETLAFRRSL